MVLNVLLPFALLFSNTIVGFEYNIIINQNVIKSEEIIAIHENILPWKEHIDNYSEQYNIDASLITAVIHVESRGNPNAVSYAGAQGLMQIMPKTGKSLGLDDAFDPKENIRAGVMYIAMLMDQYNNNEYATLWAWNAGGRRVANKIMPRETRMFIDKVLLLKSQL